MALKVKKTIVKKSGNKKGKPKKNMVWSEEATKYAEVLTGCDNKDHSWLYQLENCALKKQANKELFGEIKLELEDALEEHDEEKFTVDRLCAKYKWLKKEWHRIDNKIKCDTGLGRDDNKEPKWFKILSPHFCDAVDQMTCVSRKTSDLSDDEEDASLNESDASSSVEESRSSSLKKKALLSTESTSGEEERNEQENLSGMDDKDTKTCDKDSKEGIKGQLRKKTKVKKHPKGQLKPRLQTEAMLQVAKSIESSAKQQEEMKDQRLETLLKSERQQDEMFLEYQKQAEANRKHELMMAQILMQASSNTRPPHNNYTPPQPMPFPLQPSGSLKIISVE